MKIKVLDVNGVEDKPFSQAISKLVCKSINDSKKVLNILLKDGRKLTMDIMGSVSEKGFAVYKVENFSFLVFA